MTVGKYQDTRDDFHYRKKIDSKYHIEKCYQIFEWYEDQLVKNGVMDEKKKTDRKQKIKYLEDAWKRETDYVKDKNTLDMEKNLYKLCPLTTAVVDKYFKDILK
jgi:hypothetical protein